ncbi:acyltransferase, partial [Deltaproteobacteria bacterium OttesenSCG-928-M10]|nr:acyltransferase [Deltaproteobacteria bacterium OttesenSCG-928-M10]
MTYRPEIDGLRTIAVLTVVLYHAGLGLISGGFVGVDMFFVISGFLITGILVRDLEKGEFSLARFYERRCRRILPPLLVMAMATSAWAWFILLPYDFVNFGRSLAAAATFWSNIYFYKNTGYFDAAAETMPLLHTWSLAVEEQFYILYPLLLFFIYKRTRLKPMTVLMAVFLLSMAGAAWALYWGAKDKAAFFLLHFRAWELLLGGLVALLPACPKLNRLKLNFLALTGLALAVAPALIYTDKTVFPGPAAMPPCLGIALLIYIHGAGVQGSLVGRLLSTAPFTGIGKISYALYLWHWPLLVLGSLASYDGLSGPQASGLVLAAAALSALSYFFIEQPVRQKRFLRTRRRVLAASLCALLLVAAGGRVIRYYGGFPSRLPDNILMYDAAIRDLDPDVFQYDFKVTDLNGPMPPYRMGPDSQEPAFVIW